MLPVVCSSPAHTLRLCLFAAARGRRVTRIADPQAARSRARRSTQPQPPALQRQDLTLRINRKTLEYHSAHLQLVAPSNFIFTLQSPASATDGERVRKALPSRTCARSASLTHASACAVLVPAPRRILNNCGGCLIPSWSSSACPTACSRQCYAFASILCETTLQTHA